MQTKPAIEPSPQAFKRRTVLASSALALISGAGFAAWHWGRTEKPDAAVDTLFSQTYPAAPEKQAYPLSQLKGKVVILNFWATWCAPCVEEMPELSDLAQKWGKDLSGKIQTIGLAIDSEVNVDRFCKQMKVSYPLLVAGGAGTEVLRLFGNASGSLPFTALISPKGVIAHRILGRFKANSLDTMARQLAV